MTPTARYGSVASLSLLVACLTPLTGCGGSGQSRPLTAATVQRASLGFQHRLSLSTYMLCDSAGGGMRCRGLHALDTEEEGWMSYPGDYGLVSVGSLMHCGLQNGEVVCWGDDPVDGSADSLHQALCIDQSFHGLTGVRELALHEDTGCVVTSTGVARCWGATLALEDYHDFGMYDVVRGAHGLAVGAAQGCALTASGVRCWGDPVGLPDADEPLPAGRAYGVTVPDPAQVVVGDGFACARSTDRRVFCWGYDAHGTLGRGPLDPAEQHAPREVPDLRAVDLVSSSDNVCARTEQGQTFCWGGNTSGQLGLGHTRRVETPTHVPALDAAVDLALSAEAMCARFDDQSVRCAGDLTAVMAGHTIEVMGPQRLAGVVATRLHLSDHAACFSTAQGVRCVGGGGYLRRGHQEAAAGWAPTLPVAGDITDLALQSESPCVRLQDGRLRCDQHPFLVEQTGTLAFESRGSRACFVDAAHRVHCWVRGRNEAPARLAGLDDAVEIAMTLDRVCAITAGGSLVCRPWDPQRPTVASGLSSNLTDFVALAVSSNSTCALRQGGQVLCWDGVTPHSGEITGISALATASGQMCGIEGGRVRCLEFQQHAMSLGDPLPEIEGAVELASAANYFCARDGSGAVWCWGKNDSAQLGVLPPTVRLAFTALSDQEATPVDPASFACQGTVEYDGYETYDEYGEEYEDDGF